MSRFAFCDYCNRVITPQDIYVFDYVGHKKTLHKTCFHRLVFYRRLHPGCIDY